MTEDIFFNPDFDLELFRKANKSPPAKKNYIIYFTPRSGSSWLGDVLHNSQKFGTPGEWLNPDIMPKAVKSINANNAKNYFAMLRRRLKTGDVFGMEVTYFQLNRVFPNNSNFFDIFRPNCPSFFLIREDIVGQAISLAKAVQTKIFHAPFSSGADILEADSTFSYDKEAILQWLKHIRSMEEKTEIFFDEFNVKPIGLTYEGITQKGALMVANAFAKRLDVKEIDEHTIGSRHIKIATELNSDFAERFRKDCRNLLVEIHASRAKLLATTKASQDLFFRKLAKVK